MTRDPLNHSWDRLIARLDRRPYAVALGLFVLTVLTCGAQLQWPDIQGDDEALDAGVVWEMAENGHWLLPMFNGEMIPEKPPLFFWLAAGVARLRGNADEVAVRLPSVVMAAVTVTTVFFAGRLLVGTGPALLAALMILSAPMMVARARTGRVDMTLVACATGAFFAAAFGLGRTAKRWQRNLFWLLAALAVLAKAGAGLGVVACGTLALLLALGERPTRLWTPEGVATFFLLGFGWHALAVWKLGRTFVTVNLVQQNLDHFIGGSDGGSVHRGLDHLFRPTVDLLAGLLPWSILGLGALRGWRPAWHSGARLGLLWTVAGLVFFSAADSRHSYYVAPLLPSFALFWGATLWEAERAAQPQSGWVRVGVASLAIGTIVTAAATVLLRWWAASDWVWLSVSDHTNAILLWDWWSQRPLQAVLLVLALSAAIVFSLAMIWRQQFVWAFVVCLVAVSIVQVDTEAVEGRQSNARMSLKTFAGTVSHVDGPVYFYGPVIRQIVYHARRHISRASPNELSAAHGVYLIATESQLPALREQLRFPAEELAEGRGVVDNATIERVVLLRLDNNDPSAAPRAVQ